MFVNFRRFWDILRADLTPFTVPFFKYQLSQMTKLLISQKKTRIVSLQFNSILQQLHMYSVFDEYKRHRVSDQFKTLLKVTPQLKD